MKLIITLVLLVLIAQAPAWSVYAVRISDLDNSPLPPNPVRTWGKVVSESPLMVTNGKKTIQVNGMTAKTGDFITITGNWDGSVLTVSSDTGTYFGPANIPMIYIPAGSFLMGNNGNEDYTHFSYPNELPQHSVYLSGYWIGKYEVTRGEYRQFMNAGGYSNSAYWSSAGWSLKGSRTQPNDWDAVQDWGSGTFTQTDSHPVVGVSYYEAEAFCNWAGGHLPTEAQWEKAARWTGSYPNVYPWGNTWDSQKCNNYEDINPAGGGYEKGQTSPVGSYPSGASPYGCHDMAGNMWEWCKDWYGTSYYSQTPPGGWVDPQGLTSGSSYRVMRGGSWGVYNNHTRCAYRGYRGPDNSYNYLGFRLAR